MAALIELEGVRKTYPMRGGDVHALRGISLELEAGELVSIVGTSGSGKSTLLYLIGMLMEPSQGSYRFDGRELASLSDVERSKLRGREIGFVFQSFHLVPQIDVLRNVLLAARYAQPATDGQAGRAALERRATELLERVGLSHRLRHRPIELSNGEMQRVAIARALLTAPRLILADEPTGNLDEDNGNHVFELLSSLQHEGKTVVLVTHDPGLAARTPRCIRLRNGEVQNGAA
jgi:putative ABC transport system ATP-binding protein